MKVIDVRCRPPYKTFVNDWFYGKQVLGQLDALGLVAPSAKERSMRLLLQEMEQFEVIKGVAMARVAFDSPDDISVSNDDVTDLVTDYPDRFIGVASVDLLNTEAALNDIDKYVTHGKLSGVVIEPGYCNPAMSFDNEKLYPIYEKCQREDIFVMLGSGAVYHDLATSKPEAFDHVALDFPKLRILVGHAGFPWIVESCWVAMKRPNVYLSPDSYIVQRPGWNLYCDAANSLITDKMLFGTAYPFMSFEAGLTHAKQHINKAVLEKYLYGNAARFFGLE